MRRCQVGHIPARTHPRMGEGKKESMAKSSQIVTGVYSRLYSPTCGHTQREPSSIPYVVNISPKAWKGTLSLSLIYLRSVE